MMIWRCSSLTNAAKVAQLKVKLLLVKALRQRYWRDLTCYFCVAWEGFLACFCLVWFVTVRLVVLLLGLVCLFVLNKAGGQGEDT